MPSRVRLVEAGGAQRKRKRLMHQMGKRPWLLLRGSCRGLLDQNAFGASGAPGMPLRVTKNLPLNGSTFAASSSPLSGVYAGSLQEQGKPDMADQVTLSFEPLEGGAGGRLMHGEGKCIYGTYTVEGTVSAGGVASVTRSGGLPNSGTAAAMAAAAASSESRQERKRRREKYY